MPYKDRSKQRDAQQRAYIRQKEQILQKQRERRGQINARTRNRYSNKAKFVRSLKEKTPCLDCGKQYPHYVMDFDHVRGDKIGSISKMICGASLELIKLEIAKCDIVCSNCHRVRTYLRSS